MQPRRSGRLPALLVAASLAAFFFPLLSGQQVYRRVTWRLLAPCRHFLGVELKAGEFPSWYPYEQLGTAFHAQAVCGVLHPLSWLSAWMRAESVLSLQILCGVALAALGTWFFARTLGAAPFGCAIAAVSYALSGYLVSTTGNEVFLWSAAHLPLQLAAFASAARRGWSRGALALAVLATVSSALMGDVQGAAVFAAMAGLTGLALAQGGARWRYLAGSVLAAGLAFGLAAPQLLPSLLFLRETARGGAGLSYWEATLLSLHPLRLPELLLPAFSPIGAPGRAENLFGSTPGLLFFMEALGGSALVSALALAALATRSIDRRVRWSLGALGAVGLLLALGRHTPLFGLVRSASPLLRSFRYPEKFVPLALAALSAGAALGWTAADRSWRRRGAIAAAAAFVLAGAALLAARSVTAFASDYLHDLARSLALGGAVLAAAAWLCGRRAWALGALALVAGEVTAGSRRAWDTRPLSDSAAPPETIAALRQLGVRPGEGRVTNAGFPWYPLDEAQLLTTREREWMDLERRFVLGSMGGWFGVESANYYMTPRPAFRVLEEWPPAELLLSLAPRFNVVAAFVPDELLARIPGLPAASAAFSGGIRLIRLPDPWPRVFLAGAAAPRAEELPLQQVARLSRGQVLVEDWTGPPEPPAEGAAAVEEYQPQRVRVEVDAVRESFLVLNDLASAGWSATVSGRSAPIWTANAMVRAVRVPAGHSTIEFRYRVPGLREGVALFALAAAILLAALAFRPLWRGGGRGRHLEPRLAGSGPIAPLQRRSVGPFG